MWNPSSVPCMDGAIIYFLSCFFRRPDMNQFIFANFLRICEICGSTAKNVVCATEAELIEQLNEGSANPSAAPPSETRSFWHGHRFLNFLLACMVFAFVISWLFHFNVPG